MDSEQEDNIKNWIKIQHDKNRKVVLVASGGTRVSLEKNPVRFLENFSTGMRGAISVEKFIASGYAVCFLHRDNSLFPWSRNLPSGRALLDMYKVKKIGEDSSQEVFSLKDEDMNSTMINGLKSYKKAIDDEMLLVIDFTYLYEYLKLLQYISESLSSLGEDAMIYLAAAVSDFYTPYEDMPEHKIESEGDEIILKMKTVPKMLSHLVDEWAPNAFVVSFKLETNDSIVVSKARDALKKYNHHVVIANLMKDRRTNVIIITKDSEHNLVLSEKEKLDGGVIEDKIINSLIRLHYNFTVKRYSVTQGK
ncbi:bifunctional phosphopantothenoylcysteine decarboxylase/phosphopantothenate synthase [Finch poxvirus]|uniref:Bifunctional phosphopantothenoylcysteine decarboxylase n=2 Tax=unclassified Avipoxvirus TaxID=336487 RepID=A0AAT9UQB9_9POXV|nr:bifunctional phosphopantothenoylcysteine decarboxylase/phosphopantothenate synthase [Finch poxvirus]UOX39083.1 bifunctional phosphopantothenoylcysteine decarboxylase/phosphopantothenate synthase [Finch poxvirus]